MIGKENIAPILKFLKFLYGQLNKSFSEKYTVVGNASNILRNFFGVVERTLFQTLTYKIEN